MRYSQLIGILCCIALCGVCFMPWSIILSKQIFISGMNTEGTGFGKPGLMNIMFSIVMIILFSIKKIWSKRINVCIAALNMAWAFRNYLLFTSCDGGECLVKQPSLYVFIFLAIIILVMTFLPKMATDNGQ